MNRCKVKPEASEETLAEPVSNLETKTLKLAESVYFLKVG